MNAQREVIYKKRRYALYGERMGVETANAIHDVCSAIVAEYQDSRDFDGFEMELFTSLTIQSPVSDEEFLERSSEELTDAVFSKAMEHYVKKNALISQMALPVIQRVHSTQGEQYKNIEIPLTDGKKALPLVVNMEDALAKEGRNIRLELEKATTLAMIDLHWKEHLREMDDLRQSVQNARYEQKDPLLIYKFESFGLFEKLMEKINRDIVSFLFRANLPSQQANEAHATPGRQADPSLEKVSATRNSSTLNPNQASNVSTNAGQQSEMKKEPVKVVKKPGRNDKVEVRDLKTGETQVVKFKSAEQKVEQGFWEILNVIED